MKKLKRARMLALVAAVLAMGTSSWAAKPTEAEARDLENRARGYIAAFPGLTMHGNGHTYSRKDAILDDDGASHVRFERQYRGLRVIGGDFVVHMERNGNFRDTSRTLNRVLLLETRATWPEQLAVESALADNPGYTQAGKAELVVYARGEGDPQLAFDIALSGTRPDGTPSELHVIVAAHRGTQLDKWDDVHTDAGTGKTLYSGNVPLETTHGLLNYQLKDPTRGNTYTNRCVNTTCATLYTDADNVWGNNTTSDSATAAADAQYGTNMTWDFYRNVFGRNGIKNNGVGSSNRVHYSRKYNNAFWSDSCFCMTYGDGDGTTFGPLVSLDVAGHEMSHGVTAATANLTYSGESGGLNEATSDIFGTAVEFYAGNGSDQGDYLIGEKIVKPGFGAAALRFMDKPSRDGASPDNWSSTLKNLDVHYSSGPANHFFYLLSEGSGAKTINGVSYNSPTYNGSTVTGIGQPAAVQIWYRALTVYMTSSTNYAQARAATLSAAADLFGAGSAQQNAVAAAWSAVNVN